MKRESVDTLVKFLKLQENLHGAESTQVGKVLARLAAVHVENQNYVDAQPLLQRALRIEESSASPDPAFISDIAKQINRLDFEQQNHVGETLESLKVSTDRIPAFSPMFEPLTGHEQSELNQNTLPGSTHARVDPLENAIKDWQLQIRRIKQNSGNESTAVADALTKLADLYCRREQLNEMEPLLIEALRIRESICGITHLSVSTDLKNLGRLYYFKQRFDLAEPLLKRAMSIREAALGPYHSYVADVAEWYARLLKKTNRLDEAAVMDALVAESRTKYGSDWEKFRAAGTKAVEAGNLLEAQAMWLAALDESSDFRFDDPRLSTTLECLAEIYWTRGKYDKAEPLCKQILQISETLLGPEHTDVALAANNLALLCERQGKHAEAAILYQQALAIGEKFLGRDHPDVVNIRDSHSKARSMAQKQIEQKLQGRWNRSGWWKAYQSEER